MVATSGWFGSERRPLFGWLHAPDSGTARAGVVFCPSFGLESTFTHSTIRRFAQQLADLGFVSVRFDYDGCGDSAGQVNDPQRVSTWQSSVSQAIELLHSITDRPLILVGMRAGALLATYEAQRQGGVDALVLWDPPRSGRSFVRELRTRHSVSFGDDPQSAPMLSFMGASFSPETADLLGELDLRTFEELPAAHSLLVQHPGRMVLSGAAEASSTAVVTVVDAPDENDLILRGIIPTETLERATNWLDQLFRDGDYTKVGASPLVDSSSAFGEGESRVTERVVELGPNKLFGILAEPERASAVPDAPTLIFVPDGITPHVGLSRMWVEMSRSWASEGFRVLRFDVSGNGDSEVRPGNKVNTVAALDHISDVRDAAQAISPDDPTNVVFIGICSGAYQSIEAAFELTPRGVYIMNPAFSFLTPERPASRHRRARQATRRWLTKPLARPVGLLARRISPNLKNDEGFDWDFWFEACFWQQSVLRRTTTVPELAWRFVNRTLLEQRPTDILRRIADSDTDVLVICGDPDFQFIDLGARHIMRRLEAQPNFTLVHLPDLDHSVMKSGQQERIIAVLTEHVRSRLGAASANGSASDPRPTRQGASTVAATTSATAPTP